MQVSLDRVKTLMTEPKPLDVESIIQQYAQVPFAAKPTIYNGYIEYYAEGVDYYADLIYLLKYGQIIPLSILRLISNASIRHLLQLQN